MSDHMIYVDAEKCIGCGLCRLDCPQDNITIADRKAVIKAQNCIKCGHCVAICPRNAVSMTGFKDLPTEIEKPTVLNPNQLMEALRTRRSIRQFKDQTVAPEVIEQVIEAGRFTPTAKNAQNISYIVLREEIDSCERIAVRLFRRLLPVSKLVNRSIRDTVIDDHFFFKKAPVVILILSQDKVDGALAASNMELMAEACGLGVLYSGFFTIVANISLTLRRKLDLKRKDRVVTTLVLGYPNVTYHRTAQRETASVRLL